MSSVKQQRPPKSDKYVDLSKQDDFLFNKTPILASALQKLKRSQKRPSSKPKPQDTTIKKLNINELSDNQIQQISAPKKKIKKNPENAHNLPNFAYLPLQKDLFSFFTINKISLKSMEMVPQPKFQIGTLVLTAICDRGIGGKFLVTNLFRNKKGYIDFREISQLSSKQNNFEAIEAYSEPGQYVICSVVKSLSPNHIQLSLKKFVQLDMKSLRINQIIPAEIKSKEQLGCHLMVYNCKKYKFFLPKAETPDEAYDNLEERKQIIVSIANIDHERHLVKVSIVHSQRKQQQSLDNALNLRGIEQEQLSKYELEQYVSPGTLVHTKIVKIVGNGVFVKFLKIFIGFIHADHLNHTVSSYKIDDKLINRIIYSCSNPPLIYLSQRHASLHQYEPQYPLYTGINKPKHLEQIQKSFMNIDQEFYIHPSQMHSELENIGKFWVKENNYFERYQIMTTRKLGVRVGELAKQVPFNNFKIYSGAQNGSQVDPNTKKKFKVMCLDVWNKVIKISSDDKVMKSNRMLFSVDQIDLSTEEGIHKQYCGFVTSVNEHGVVVQFCNNIKGTIPRNQVKMSGMQIDQNWKGKGIQVYISHIKQKNGFITLSLLHPNMRQKSKHEKHKTKSKEQQEATLMGTVVSIVPNSINPLYVKLRQKIIVKISIFKGIRPASLNNLPIIQNLTQNFEIGQKIRVFKKGKEYYLYPPEQLSDKDLRICRVVSFKGSYVRLQTNKNEFHSCHICDVSDLIIPYPFSTLKTKEYYIGRVLPNNLICLRNSIVLNGIPQSILDCKQKYSIDEDRGDYRNRILTIGSNGLKENMIIFGYIKNFTDKGCFVSVSHDYQVRIQLSELTDQHIPGDKSKFYPTNRLVLCRLISQKVKPNNPTKHLFDASARQSIVKLGYPLNDDLLQVGLTVSGYITGYSKGKALVRLCGSKFTGILHPNQVPSINKDEPIQKSLKVGTFLDEKLKIIQLNNEGKRLIRLSCQPKYFNKYKDINITISADQRVVNLYESYEEMLKEKMPQVMEEEQHIEEQQDSEDEYNRIKGLLAMDQQQQIPELQEQQQDDNEDQIEQEIDEQSQSEEQDQQLSEQQREKPKMQENSARMLAQFENLPHSEQTYQSLILANNTPESHIQYISSMINNSTPEKIREQFVRSIGQLQQIKEKQNLWVAWLNMETILGNFEETVKKAIKAEVGIQVYSRILQILRQQDKWQLARQIGKKMLKNNNRDTKAYILMLRHYLLESKQHNLDQKPHFKQMIRRAKQCLKANDITLIESQYGKILYEEKQAEKARTVFGDLLINNPKRTDLWSMHVDLEIKYGVIDKAREILERCLTIPLKKKKLITILKKYYQIQLNHGSAESAGQILERAKSLADEYAQNQQDSNNDD